MWLSGAITHLATLTRAIEATQIIGIQVASQEASPLPPPGTEHALIQHTSLHPIVSRKFCDFRNIPHLARVRVLPQPWEAAPVCTPNHTQQASQTPIAISDLSGVMGQEVLQTPEEAAATHCTRAVPGA